VGASTKTYFVDDVGMVGAGLSSLGCEPSARSGLWYALYVRSRHEKVVEAGLKGKGYSAFSPFYRTKRKRVDRNADRPRSIELRKSRRLRRGRWGLRGETDEVRPITPLSRLCAA
jgi:Transcription termination factor nusG